MAAPNTSTIRFRNTFGAFVLVLGKSNAVCLSPVKFLPAFALDTPKKDKEMSPTIPTTRCKTTTRSYEGETAHLLDRYIAVSVTTALHIEVLLLLFSHTTCDAML
jgi:hypothetical protein